MVITMIILNETSYAESIITGNFTNNGLPIVAKNSYYYLPLLRHCKCDKKQMTAMSKLIDKLYITNLTGEELKKTVNIFYPNGIKLPPEHKIWQISSPDNVTFDCIEMDVLYSIHEPPKRRLALIQMYFIKLLTINKLYAKMNWNMLVDFSKYKEGNSLWKRYIQRNKINAETETLNEIGIIYDFDKKHYYIDKDIMLAYHKKFIEYKTPNTVNWNFPLDCDMIYYDSKTPFNHNFDEMIECFEILRDKQQKEIEYLTGKKTIGQSTHIKTRKTTFAEEERNAMLSLILLAERGIHHDKYIESVLCKLGAWNNPLYIRAVKATTVDNLKKAIDFMSGTKGNLNKIRTCEAEIKNRNEQ